MSGPAFDIEQHNTVLYCRNWDETVQFYRTAIGLPVAFENDWFVEFSCGGGAMLSIANPDRASVGTIGGQGITLTWRVDDVVTARASLGGRGVEVTSPKSRWGATVCYVYDPEGNRIELWSEPCQSP